METARLTFQAMSMSDWMIARHYEDLNPSLRKLDPTVGECNTPVFFSLYSKKTPTAATRVIGMCCLYNCTDSAVEIGIRIFVPKYWDKGYGKEAINALCDFAFAASPSITEIIAKTPDYNVRAKACYEKCGFTESSRSVVDGYNIIYMVRRR